MKEITTKLLQKYNSITLKALGAVKKAKWDESRISEGNDFILMCESYVSDAKYFEEKGEFVLAYGALNYAHAWLDAGARLGIFKVKDNVLFTVDDD